MNTHETAEAVFHALLDPAADLIESARSLGLALTEFLQIAESPQVTGAIEALERLAEIRTRALLARSAHTAIEALERIAAGDPQTAAATETCRKAAAQLLRMAGTQANPAHDTREARGNDHASATPQTQVAPQDSPHANPHPQAPPPSPPQHAGEHPEAARRPAPSPNHRYRVPVEEQGSAPAAPGTR